MRVLAGAGGGVKRSAPQRRKRLERRARLRVEPDKVAEFVARGREVGREGMRSSVLRRAEAAASTAPGLTGRAQSDPPPRRPRVAFHAPTAARDHLCARCGRESGRRAQGWHHWLPQQHIRVYVRGLRLSEQSTRAILRRLLSDARNLVALCHDCHQAHELWSRRLSGEEVPYEAKVFALELGPEWAERLRQLYPGGQR